MDLFPGVPPFEVFLGISEAVDHLEILKEKGIVKVNEKEGKDYYSLETWRSSSCCKRSKTLSR